MRNVPTTTLGQIEGFGLEYQRHTLTDTGELNFLGNFIYKVTEYYSDPTIENGPEVEKSYTIDVRNSASSRVSAIGTMFLIPFAVMTAAGYIFGKNFSAPKF